MHVPGLTSGHQPGWGLSTPASPGSLSRLFWVRTRWPCWMLPFCSGKDTGACRVVDGPCSSPRPWGIKPGLAGALGTCHVAGAGHQPRLQSGHRAWPVLQPGSSS